MAAMSVLVSSDVIAQTMEGRKIARTVVTANDTATGIVTFRVDKIKRFNAATSGFTGFHIADTSSANLTAVIPVVLSGENQTNQIAVTPGGNSNGMVLRFLCFEGAV